MEENPNKTPAEQPFDETTQWSGPHEGDPRDPTKIGEILGNLPVAQEATSHVEQGAEVRAAEVALRELLKDPSATNVQIRDATDWLNHARNTRAGAEPTKE